MGMAASAVMPFSFGGRVSPSTMAVFHPLLPRCRVRVSLSGLFVRPAIGLALLPVLLATTAWAEPPAHHWAIVLHGGAGVIERNDEPEREAEYRAGMTAAIEAGEQVLERGGSSLDAVEATIHILEDDPLFNAGNGAVFTADGRNQTRRSHHGRRNTQGRRRRRCHAHAASHQPGARRNGKIATRFSGWVGADAFLSEAGLEQDRPSYFFTERRWQSLIKQLQKGRQARFRRVLQARRRRRSQTPARPNQMQNQVDVADSHMHGTVGVVALDRQGNIAAGTSTGGMQAKRPGRVGDSPIIGAGTYASNQSCAVSGTGTGEYFIRLAVAREVCALVHYKHMSCSRRPTR